MNEPTGARGPLRPLIQRLLPIVAAAFVAFAGLSLTVAPAAVAAESSAMVIDANTGKVLYNDAGDERRYPASLTKMMTLYMTFELIEKGRLKYDDKIRVSAQAASQPPSKLGLEAGDTITVRNAVLSLVTKSANDMAAALAEHIAGSEANFARLMTAKAHAIGMAKTTFRNASGLPDTDQVTTARDMLTLALRLQDEFPTHYKLFATQRFTYAGDSYRNHNTLLRSYRGTDGIKTGYTRASGFNLVSSVHRGGKHLVAAVFGGKTSGQRNARMRTILDRSFIKAATRRVRPRLDRPQLIARPKLIERPAKTALAPVKPPPLPHPTPTSEPSQAASMTTAMPAVPAAPVPTPEPVKTAESASPASIDDRISIARVRRVGVAQHFAERRATARIAREQEQHQAQTASTNDPAAPRSISELIASTTAAPSDARAGLSVQHGGAITPAPSPATPVGLAPPSGSGSTTTLGFATNPAATGRAPSTLQTQLSRILADHRNEMTDAQPSQPDESRQAVATSPAPRYAAATIAQQPHPPTTQPANGTHLIQIGAYNTADEAERQLEAIRQRAKGILSSAAPVTESVTKGQRRFYRARFAGFDSQGATNACQELRRRSIDCFVTRTP